jgi:class 3 adenylate cyclase/predicted ATPase
MASGSQRRPTERNLDIEGWLRALGLERHAQTFRDNAVDADVLRDLTEVHLRELGLPLGARLKILKAIAALDRAEQPADAPEVGRAASRTEAERRQLTVMFCDLVGSTSLAARLDPEDMREIIGAYYRCCADLIGKAGGYVAQYLGDGVLAYFGYPEAHEHDEERAVRAGLALVEEAPKLKTAARVPLQVRIGVATGLVVVGDLVGQRRGIVGDTPNLAARLQGIAEANTVVIADSTRRLLGNLFELRDLGFRNDLKGIAGPTRAWVAVRTSSVGSRFDALHTTDLSAMVGREDESELLLDCWSRAKSGDGQVALVSGEAGIGKSRLTAALLQRLSGEPLASLRYFCSPHRTDSALHPVIDHLERGAGLAYDDNPRDKLDKLDALLARTSTSPEDAALFAEMLSLPNDGRRPELELPPNQRRQRTLNALVSQVDRLAKQNRVLMIFEDAHWIDPTSLELLGRIVERIAALPVLLIVTFRPDFVAPWLRKPHVTSVKLDRLGGRHAATIVARIVGDRELPPDVTAEIVERTDGIPLFVEEMTKAVLEAGGEDAARRAVAATPSSALAVPASLHASLMARLDRLGPAKEIAQIGSAIGREFSYALLSAVARKSEADLRSALDRLVQAGLLFRRGAPPKASYLFNHALVQDAAYGTLLREPRRVLHERIAHVLETTDCPPETLARHCAEAGLIEKAAGLWGRAGQQSMARSALAEAAAHFTRALDHIATLPSTPELRRERIKFQVALITPLIHTKGYAAPEPKAAAEQARLLIEQAEALGEPPDDPLLLFSVLYGFWVANLVAFNGDVCCHLATQFLALAEKQEAAMPLISGHRMMGLSSLYVGDLEAGRNHLDRTIALYDPGQHRGMATRLFGQDLEVSALGYQSWTSWLLGYPDASLREARDALRMARDIGQAATLMYALAVTAIPMTLCGDHAAAAAQTEEQIALAEEKGASIWKAYGLLLRGSILAVSGRAADGVRTLIAGIAAFRATGSTLWLPFHLAHRARAHAELGQFDVAWRCIGDAISTAETTTEKWCEAELHRTAGDLELMSPEPDAAKAEASFQRALALARDQKARSWELRAATSLARHWCEQGKRRQAYDLLAPVHGQFTEGFETLDVKQAGALLAK